METELDVEKAKEEILDSFHRLELDRYYKVRPTSVDKLDFHQEEIEPERNWSIDEDGFLVTLWGSSLRDAIDPTKIGIISSGMGIGSRLG